MERKNLNIFTKISFHIAIATISVVLLFMVTSMITLNESIASIMQILVLLIFLGSVFSIPLSIISMFSKENFAKRIFSLIVNLLPICIIVYGLVKEFIDEFLRNAS
ncbi:2-acyl-glycerophospho-ethanolamine acyltransferase [Sutcliffiella horikoshii]|uniref:2-acyl-glycerophospho-ethanolamine acyltransferase n=1 Tax=Sutcliffiella horikoshii TaxID=79883 RepID=A0A5D4TI27_9BACI|nr:2-acyl-glycerophospho-ethanolamine acyltransferase [Sutcliffiella horikoshii]